MNKFILTLSIVIAGLGVASTSWAATYSINPGSAGSLCTGNYVGRACAPSGQTTINIPQAGHYFVSVRVNRGNNIERFECQSKESFYMNINGQRTPIVRDPDSCEWSGTIKTQSVEGEYSLKQGQNTIQLFHAHAGESGIGIESLSIESIIFQSIPEDGICGGANGGEFETTPTAGLCEKGTFSGMATTGTWWIWSCNGINGGSSDSCRARAKSEVRPVCGSSNNQTFPSKPTSGLCSVGNASSVSGSGPWNWTCANDGYFVECSAKITAAPVCGSSNDKTFSAKPISGLCSVGDASSVSGNGPWDWKCTSGARFVACDVDYAKTAIQIVKSAKSGGDTQIIEQGADAVFTITVTNTGEENLKNVKITDVSVTDCSKTASQTQDLYNGNLLDPNESFTYSCTDTDVNSAYTNVVIVAATATTSTITVNDEDDSRIEIKNKVAPNCGSSNNQTFPSKPTSGLCSVGNASSVSGSGPWNWTCANDGKAVSCNANLANQPEAEPESEEKEDKDGAIGNTVWNDLNKNCIQDAGEEGIVGVKLKLYNGNNIDTDRTNTKGRYKFKNLKKGTYKVIVAQETLPAGCYQVCDPDGTKMDGKTKVKIKGDEYHRKADFGYYCQSNTPTAPITSPSTGPGAVAGTISFVLAALSATYVQKKHAHDVK